MSAAAQAQQRAASEAEARLAARLSQAESSAAAAAAEERAAAGSCAAAEAVAHAARAETAAAARQAADAHAGLDAERRRCLIVCHPWKSFRAASAHRWRHYLRHRPAPADMMSVARWGGGGIVCSERRCHWLRQSCRLLLHTFLRLCCIPTAGVALVQGVCRRGAGGGGVRRAGARGDSRPEGGARGDRCGVGLAGAPLGCRGAGVSPMDGALCPAFWQRHRKPSGHTETVWQGRGSQSCCVGRVAGSRCAKHAGLLTVDQCACSVGPWLPAASSCSGSWRRRRLHAAAPPRRPATPRSSGRTRCSRASRRTPDPRRRQNPLPCPRRETASQVHCLHPALWNLLCAPEPAWQRNTWRPGRCAPTACFIPLTCHEVCHDSAFTPHCKTMCQNTCASPQDTCRA